MDACRNPLWTLTSAAIVHLLCWLPPAALAQSASLENARKALGTATAQQRDVLAELARILREEKVMLSDGAVQAALEAMLDSEKQQAEAIRELGRRTLGRGADELTEEDKAERDRLAHAQEVTANRYQRLEKSIETKAGSQPDSVFVRLLILAEDGELRDNMAQAGSLIEENQLGRALRMTNAIVATLEEMVGTLSSKVDAAVTPADSDAAGGFSVPSIVLKNVTQQLLEFDWAGATPENLTAILDGVKQLRQLAERQREIADQVKKLAKTQSKADTLAPEEWEIRYLALEVGTKLALLDPKLEKMIRQAVGSIEQAIPGMESGPLTDAIEPATRAADELEAAADHLHATWKDILDRIKQYTQETAPIFAASHGIPHGMSKETMQLIQKLVFTLLRATGALSEAIEQQTELMEQTRKTKTDDELTALQSEQDALPTILEKDVIPYSVRGDDLPAHLRETDSAAEVASAVDFLNDAIDRMQRSSSALADADREEAIKRQEEAIGLMNDALWMMIRMLQRLLGQFSPPAIAAGSQSGLGGLALDPGGGNGKPGGWIFDLPSDKRESVRQAFRGTFPQRYDRAIKQYYQAIAEESEE